MSLRAELYNEFRKVAQQDEELQARPSYSVEDVVLHEVLSPIKGILKDDAVYGQYETDLYHQMYELRQICEEAKIAHTTDDAELIADRNTLAGALQGLLESVQERKHGFVQIDYQDIDDLPNMSGVMKGYATIYREFMRQPGIADALDQVADNITAARQRLWQPNPEFDLNAEAANDHEYGQEFAQVS